MPKHRKVGSRSSPRPPPALIIEASELNVAAPPQSSRSASVSSPTGAVVEEVFHAVPDVARRRGLDLGLSSWRSAPPAIRTT
jgi:hypothetical protein